MNFINFGDILLDRLEVKNYDRLPFVICTLR